MRFPFLFSTCLFSHGDVIKDVVRNDQGDEIFVLRCFRCQQVIKEVFPRDEGSSTRDSALATVVPIRKRA